LLLFVLCLIIPGSLFLGAARLTPYRIFLLAAALPLLWQVFRGGLGRLTGVDALFVLYVLWLALSVVVHEGMARFEFIVILTIESLCGYLFGRLMVRNADDYRLLMRCFLGGLLIMAPFAAIEMLTDTNLVSRITSLVLMPFEQAEHPPRLGLHRAQVSFEHPILFGLFCSLGFANAFYIYRLKKTRRLFWMGTSGFTTFASLSSAPMLSLLIQTIMILWDRLVPVLRSKWLLLAGIGIVIFGVLELATPNGAVDFLVSHLTLVPETAEYRILTLQYTVETLSKYPVFGIPDGASELPWWHTGSIDNFWLSTAASYGIPTAAFLILAILLHLLKVMFAPIGDAETSDLRSGHLIAVTGLIFTLTTVHIWGAASVMVMAYLGAGAWIYCPQRERPHARDEPRGIPEPSPVVSKALHPALPATPPVRPGTIPAPGRVRGATARYGGGS
jgi:hypothetical protein